MTDLTTEWLNDRAWFEQYIAEATLPAITQPELFLLCLVEIHASRREMMAALNRSSSYVADRLDNLEFLGLVVNTAPGQARTLVLTEAGRAALRPAQGPGYTVIRENGNVWKLATIENK